MSSSYPVEYLALRDPHPDFHPGVAQPEDALGSHDERRHLVPGGSFALDLPPAVEPIWGDCSSVLWASGESLIVVSPTGLIKSTLAQRLTLARIGRGKPEVLGFPVQTAAKKVLYVAADRPRQIQRSMARMVTESDRALLDDMLIVHRGPLPFDLAKDPEKLGEWVEALGAGTLIIDSLKDVALDLSKDETGSRVNRALAGAIQVGVEVLVLHHQRKAAEGRQPKALDEVYGSTWITAGAGSVILFWGKPGDPVVSMHHLKQPSEEVGPLSVAIDFATGGLSIDASRDLLSILRAAAKGLNVKEAAQLLFGTQDPSRAEGEKARRQLQRLESEGLASFHPGAATGAIKGAGRYFAVALQGEIGQ